MGYFIITLIFLFICVLFYKLTNVNWYHQFLTQDFKDKDWFTKLVKWLVN